MKNQHNVIKWLETNLVFPRRAGPELYKTPVKLLKWQKELIKDVYSPSGDIKKHTIFLSGPRKCGKSALIAMLLIYMVYKDTETYNEISVTASSFDQAKKTIFQIYKEFLSVSKFKNSSKMTTEQVTVRDSDSLVQIASSNENSLAGLQSTTIVADELGRMEKADAIKSLSGGMILSDKLLIYLTNPSEKENTHFSYGIYKRAKAELKKKKSGWAVKIFQAGPDDDPFKKETWIKANPSFQNKHYRKNLMRNYTEAAETAKQNALEQVFFERQYLGRWIENSLAKWIDGTNWKIKEDSGHYGHIHAGIDLSLNRDRTCVVLSEKTDDGGYYFRPLYYLPESALSKLRATKRKITEQWIEQGYITLQKTEVIDQDGIIADLEKIKDKAKSFQYGILDLHCGGFRFSEKLRKLGIEPVPTHCYASVLTPLINELTRADQAGLFYAPDNPVFKQDFLNTLLTSHQSRNYKGVTRGNLQDSIDGAVASLLSVEQFLKQPTKNNQCWII